MNIDDVAYLIAHRPQCNFLAMAITPLQAVGVNAAIMYLKNNNIRINGYILVAAHPDTGRVLTRDNFIIDNDEIECIDFEYVFSKRKTIYKLLTLRCKTLIECIGQKRKRKFYIVWTEVYNNLYYCISRKLDQHSVVFFKIDDGAASYLSNFNLRLSNFKAVSNSRLSTIKAYIKAGCFAIFSFFYEYFLTCNGNYLSGTIFRKIYANGKVKLVRNTNFIKYYVTALGKNKNANYEFGCDDYILINTQCLKECGLIKNHEDFEIYDKVSGIIKRIGCHILLKPHPREKDLSRYENLGWEIIKSPFSQEELLSNCNSLPRCIISIYSSTLLNVYGLFNIPVVSLAKILLKKDITNALEMELKRYIKMYNEIVYFPQDYDELDNYLNNMKKE